MIKLRNVSKAYEKNIKAVKNLTLTIDDGEFVFIAGRSGSGKSTILRLLTGELKPTEGLVEVNGTNLSRIKRRELPGYRRHLGVVFQDFRLLNDRNVFENVAFAQKVIGIYGEEARDNVTRVLKMVGLSSKYKNMPDELSGGEQQRTAIARALVNNPDIILADEPTGNLDEANSRDILDLLLEINRRGTTVIVITHSRDAIQRAGKRVIFMEKGTLLDDIPEGESINRPSRESFSAPPGEVIQGMPPARRRREKRRARIPGSVSYPEEDEF